MDSVFCLKGAESDGTGAEELFTHHSCCTKTQVDEFVKDRVTAADANTPAVFDQHCLNALSDSCQWLLASLDLSLKTHLQPQLPTNQTGPQLWMLIVAEVQADSLRRCTTLRKKFESLTLAQFKGENVREWAKAAYSSVCFSWRGMASCHPHTCWIWWTNSQPVQ